MLAHLVCPARHTITSLLSTNGQQFEDWSADDNLYARLRVRPEHLFDHVRTQLETLRDRAEPLVVALDDTILRKTGRTIPGTAYRKDPLSPPFRLNLVWAQRMIQLSAAVPGPAGEVRMIPIDYRDASTPRKPRKNAAPALWAAYREAIKQANLNTRAVTLLHHLQTQRLPAQGPPPPLHVLVDGSYTNRKVLKHLPPTTTLIGRVRRDAHLHYPPHQQLAAGRRRV
jgi:hypothetical protein